MRLHDFLEYYARERPNQDFAIMGERRLSYAEANALANQLAHAFIDAGLQKGDRFAYLSKNSLEYPLVYFGAAKAGVLPVPLNYRLAPPAWAFIINDAQAKLVLCSEAYQKSVDGIRDALLTVDRRLAIDHRSGAGWEAPQTWVARQSIAPPYRDIRDDDDAYQMYTSGATGHPKGVVLDHAAVTAHLMQLSHTIPLTPGDRHLIVAPMCHAAAALSALYVICQGGTLVIHEDFIPQDVVTALSEANIVVAMLAPAMIQACLVYVPDVAERAYETLKCMAYGASPIAEQTLRRAMEVFKCDFLQFYGMTELTAGATALSPADHRRALASKPELLLSAGRPLIGAEVRIVDEDDRPLPHGAIGEIVVRGPQMMKGYWQRPEATAAALRGGWMHTGDAGVLDEEGFLYIQDRVKDRSVSGGGTAYPRVVEDVLFAHPAIADAA